MERFIARCAIVIVISAWLALAPNAAQAEITWDFNFSQNMDPNARNGFLEAAANINKFIDDDVTIRIDADYRTLGSGILGQASSSVIVHQFGSWKTAVANDVLSNDDQTFSSHLPTGNSFDVLINRPNGGQATPYLDTSGNNTQFVAMTYANAKALGMSVGTAQFDASIAFSDAFNWDFDRSNGDIDSNAYDFVGVAMHELIHALGFVSGVDFVDTAPAGTTDDQMFARALDFTRHSTKSVADGADLDLTADTREKYFSIDGGATIIGDPDGWSKGVNHGGSPNRQASHWQDNADLGIMDPTLGNGQFATISERDLRALDVIGWNRVSAVPEPAAFPVLAIGAAALLWLRRRKQKRQSQ